MARSSKVSRKNTPARSPEARENQIINAAYDEAEKRIRDGSATSQLLTFFLKRGCLREQMEIEKIRAELRLAEAKVKEIDSREDIKELYSKAMEAMKAYRGDMFSGEDDDYDD